MILIHLKLIFRRWNISKLFKNCVNSFWKLFNLFQNLKDFLLKFLVNLFDFFAISKYEKTYANELAVWGNRWVNIDNDQQYIGPVENFPVHCGCPEPQNTAPVNNERTAGSMRVRCMQMIDLNEPLLVFLGSELFSNETSETRTAQSDIFKLLMKSVWKFNCFGRSINKIWMWRRNNWRAHCVDFEIFVEPDSIFVPPQEGGEIGRKN